MARLIPTPNGLTIESIQEIFNSFSIDGSLDGSLAGYALDSTKRFLHTWNLARGLSGSALELGANPYFTTWLLRTYTDLDITLANFFGTADTVGSQEVALTVGQERHTFKADFHHFNIETATYPFADKSFDVVFFCEILEHLQHDPTWPLREIHRVLKDDGVLILTTPNAADASKIHAVLKGHSIWDQYSGHGVYGRHSREYSFGEVHRIVEHTGFVIEQAFTADSYPFQHPWWLRNRLIKRVIWSSERRRSLGQYTFIRARKSKNPVEGLPSWLFRDYSSDLMSNE